MRPSRSIPTGLALVCLMATASTATPPQYKCVILPGTYEANAVNNFGEVVGRTAPDETGQAFYSSAGVVSPFGAASWSAMASGISDSGWVAGVVEVLGIGRAMMSMRGENLFPMGDGGATWATAYGINNDAQVVGMVEGLDSWWNHAARWDNGSFVDIAGGSGENTIAYDINSLGVVVGARNNKAAIFDPTPVLMNAPGTYNHARSISDGGYIAGTSTYPGTRAEAWVYDGSTFQVVASGPVGQAYAWDVNDFGQVVGTANNEAFLWDEGVYYSLSSLISSGAGTPYEARSINNCGVIVGVAEEGAFILVPIDDLTDTDGDGLTDRWETCGMDLDEDGTAEFLLPDADPLHKDIYVEIDHVAATPLHPEVVPELVKAFASVPASVLPNPDGSGGINLHLLVDEGDIGLAGDLFIGAAPFEFPPIFDEIKADRFGTSSERQDDDADRILAARRYVYHYGLVLEGVQAEFEDGSIDHVSGIAECFGNDFIMATRAFRFPPGLWQDQAGTLMHELGHNLGLLHGGDDSINNKTNYFSVMNYTWQIPHPGMTLDWRLDYSRSDTNPVVREALLVEAEGLAGVMRDGESVPVFVALNGDPARVTLQFTNSGPINFDGVGDPDAPPFTVEDINHIDPTVLSSVIESHRDFKDWPALQLDFRNSPSFADGVHTLCPGGGDLELSHSLIERLATVPPPTPVSAVPESATARRAPAAFPNPFHTSTRIHFSLPSEGIIRVSVFDVGGRLVKTLYQGPHAAGPVDFTWDGRDLDKQLVSGGLYFVRMDTGHEILTTRIVRM